MNVKLCVSVWAMAEPVMVTGYNRPAVFRQTRLVKITIGFFR